MTDLTEYHRTLNAWGATIARMKPRSRERAALERRMFELRTKLMFAECPPRRVPVPPAFAIPQAIEARHE